MVRTLRQLPSAFYSYAERPKCHPLSIPNARRVAVIDSQDALAIDNTAHPTASADADPCFGRPTGLETAQRIPPARLRRLLYLNKAIILSEARRIPIPEDFTGTAPHRPRARHRAGSVPNAFGMTHSSPHTFHVERSVPQQAFNMPRLEGARILVESEAGPLLQLVRNNDQRVITLSFALEESDWPLKVSFPIFLSHLLRWAHPEGWEFVRNPLTVGDSLTLPAAFAQDRGWTVRLPDGSLVQVAKEDGPTFRDTRQAGVYTVVAEDNEFYFAVNAGGVTESDIRTRLHMPTGSFVDGAETQGAPATLSWIFALLALFLILLELVVYAQSSPSGPYGYAA